MKQKRNEPEPVDVGFDSVEAVSDNAIQVILSDTGERKWIPRTVIMNEEDLVDPEKRKRADTIIVRRWFAIKEGLCEE